MKRFREILITIVLFVFVLQLRAQEFSYDAWHIGAVYLSSGDSIKGLVKYGTDDRLVQVKSGQREFAFNYEQLKDFWIIDLKDSTKRFFEIYTYTSPEGYQFPLAFEKMVESSEFKILVREYASYQNSATFINQGFAPTRDVLYAYYYLEGDVFVQFNASKRDVLEIVGQHGEAVLNYVRSNKLRFYRNDDLKKIFIYYSNLIEGYANNSGVE